MAESELVERVGKARTHDRRDGRQACRTCGKKCWQAHCAGCWADCLAYFRGGDDGGWVPCIGCGREVIRNAGGTCERCQEIAATRAAALASERSLPTLPFAALADEPEDGRRFVPVCWERSQLTTGDPIPVKDGRPQVKWWHEEYATRAEAEASVVRMRKGLGAPECYWAFGVIVINRGDGRVDR